MLSLASLMALHVVAAGATEQAVKWAPVGWPTASGGGDQDVNSDDIVDETVFDDTVFDIAPGEVKEAGMPHSASPPYPTSFLRGTNQHAPPQINFYPSKPLTIKDVKKQGFKDFVTAIVEDEDRRILARSKRMQDRISATQIDRVLLRDIATKPSEQERLEDIKSFLQSFEHQLSNVEKASEAMGRQKQKKKDDKGKGAKLLEESSSTEVTKLNTAIVAHDNAANNAANDAKERRLDPMLGNKAVTFDEQWQWNGQWDHEVGEERWAKLNKLSKAQLQERWSHLKKA